MDNVSLDYNQLCNFFVNLLIDLKFFPEWPELTFETLTWHLPRGEFRHPLEDAHKVFADVISEKMVQIFNLTKI